MCSPLSCRDRTSTKGRDGQGALYRPRNGQTLTTLIQINAELVARGAQPCPTLPNPGDNPDIDLVMSNLRGARTPSPDLNTQLINLAFTGHRSHNETYGDSTPPTPRAKSRHLLEH